MAYFPASLFSLYGAYAFCETTVFGFISAALRWLSWRCPWLWSLTLKYLLKIKSLDVGDWSQSHRYSEKLGIIIKYFKMMRRLFRASPHFRSGKVWFQLAWRSLCEQETKLLVFLLQSARSAGVQLAWRSWSEQDVWGERDWERGKTFRIEAVVIDWWMMFLEIGSPWFQSW